MSLSRARRCAGPSRRDFLQVGAIGGLGLTLPGFLGMQAAARADQVHFETVEGPAKGVIYIYLPGGLAQQESWDPKPLAPAEYRGPLGSIKTKVPGAEFGATFPKMASIVDKCVVLRGFTHGEAAHERGTHNMFTGYRPSPALKFPSMGSVVAHEFEPKNNLPQYVCVPGQPNEFAGTGYLSSSYAPFTVGGDPASSGFKVRDLSLPGGVDEARFTRRRRLLDAVNDHFAATESADSLDAVGTFYDRAYGLIGNPKAREAFDLDKEDDKTRDRYGRNQAGARMLLARRLVEAGSRFVTLTYGGWDMHDKIADGIKRNGPELDQALSTLINDLDERGLLDSTLVCVGTEFGRTPKINATAGRDHWAKVFSVLMAGGGLKRGVIHGSSDATASEPDTDPVTVMDWAATVYDRLGIKAEKELMAPGGRPIEIVDGGSPIQAILA
ncbi:DUF1501 domain-containing protein [Alienimonas californiensis]|uniref:Sulfatase n=1 Tax=Alienimonas californiensis TaxID=2527989 RepID=A0A517P582_9PLAN|nr:DUF1501 domain-containing protein [Alienimonas californiensis]QDT14533.1 hypothetical protein CA12_06080 [Alienimonas californiensis]